MLSLPSGLTAKNAGSSRWFGKRSAVNWPLSVISEGWIADDPCTRIAQVPLAFEDGQIERRADRARLQRDGLGVGRLRRRRLCSGSFFARIAEHDLEEGIDRARTDGAAPRRQLECIGATSRVRAGDDDQIGRTCQFARFDEQRVFSRGDFPRYGVAKRDMLNALAGRKHDLRGGTEDADNAENLGVAVDHFTDTVVLRSRVRCFAGECRLRCEQHERYRRAGSSLLSLCYLQIGAVGLHLQPKRVFEPLLFGRRGVGGVVGYGRDGRGVSRDGAALERLGEAYLRDLL